MYKNDTKVNSNNIAVDINGLQELLGVGKNTADRIGKESMSIFFIGKRKLFNVSKVQAYLDQKAAEGKTTWDDKKKAKNKKKEKTNEEA